MPAPLNVDREAVKTLAIAVGVREAARQMGIPEPTVKAWCLRFGWLKHATPTPQPPTVTPRNIVHPVASGHASTASEAMQNVLNQRKTKSKLLLSKYVVNAAKVASRSRAPLKDAQNVRHVAAVHSAIWPEAQGAGGLTLNLGIITGNLG